MLVGSKLFVRGPSLMSVGGRAIDAISGVFWISDSTLQSGANACPFTGASLGRIARCIVNSGSGGTCAMPPVVPLLGVETLSQVVAGTTYSLRFRGSANGFVAVFASSQLGLVALPEVQQPILVDPASAFAAGLALLDATGTAVLGWAIPSAPAVVGLPIWFQGLSGQTAPFLLSPVAGGLVR